MLFRINVNARKETQRWGEILRFIYVFVIMHTCMLQKMYNSTIWGRTFRWVAEFGVTTGPNLAAMAKITCQGEGRVCDALCLDRGQSTGDRRAHHCHGLIGIAR